MTELRDEIDRWTERATGGTCSGCDRELPVRPGGLANRPLCYICTQAFDTAMETILEERAEGCRFVVLDGSRTRWVEAKATLRQALKVAEDHGGELADCSTDLGVQRVVAEYFRIVRDEVRV